MAWVDFKRIKEEARFEPVLARYGLELKAKGPELVGLCPFHKDSRPSFRVNTEKKIFNCFGCSAKGNVLDFVSRQEGVSIKKAGELLAEWLGIEKAEKTAPRASQEPKKEAQKGKVETTATKGPVEQPVNRPLTFKLQLDPKHSYLEKRGVSENLATEFGIGYCSRGMMAGRIAIPIHDEVGELVAYAGRWAGEPPEGQERYKLPPGFQKSAVLYNLNRLRSAERLVLVEGYFGVIRLASEFGVAAVALMGRDLSPKQFHLLVSTGAEKVTLLLDGDEPGQQAADEMIPRLARRFFVRLAELPDGAQPDTTPTEVLLELLKN